MRNQFFLEIEFMKIVYKFITETPRKGNKENDELEMTNDELKKLVLYSAFVIPNSSFFLQGTKFALL